MTIPYIPAQRGTKPAPANWRAYAACADEDARLFFPSGTTGWARLAQAAPAIAVCAGCPVGAACLDWALATGQRTGVWGGRLLQSVPQGSGVPGDH